MGQLVDETWQADVSGQVYDASFPELAEWINEGALLESDMVRRGNLRWIQAGKVPSLVPFFNARKNGTPLSLTTTRQQEAVVDQRSVTDTSRSSETHISLAKGANNQTEAAAYTSLSLVDPRGCQSHPDSPIFYKCLSCGGGFCKQCARTFGSSVAVCPACGEMCKPIAQLKAQAAAVSLDHSRISEGFGLSDFTYAFSHPFKFKTSLLMGAVMFAFAGLGQSGWAIGGVYMMVGGIFSAMFANMLTFGVMSHTVETFSQGKIGGNFMPDFEDFDMWEDVIHPFFLSIAAYLSSFASFILVAIVGFYLMFSSVASQTQTIRQQIASTPGTPYYSGRDTIDQTQQVRDVLEQVKRQNDARLKQQQTAEEAAGTTAGHDEDAGLLQAQQEVEQSSQRTLEAVEGHRPEAENGPLPSAYAEFLKLAAPLVVIGFLTFLGGLIYFPAACAVAGYTRSVSATLNPLVVLDTIKRIGVDYAKLLVMSFLICICLGVISFGLGLLFLPFNLPMLGNLPAKFFGNIITFYFWTVFCCLLGLLVYKASPRLGLRL